LTLELGSLLPKILISKLMNSRVETAWDVEAGQQLKQEAGTSSH